eukprot:GSA25T00016465001.1
MYVLKFLLYSSSQIHVDACIVTQILFITVQIRNMHRSHDFSNKHSTYKT